ncbi:amino acid/polyamine/organocation transporter (APC superfamily) [Halopolyspora algeriensis]|uniref:Amino acid/polyamine/organocation transporter (APC superfamily) n=1 Tax=Halopolyspora algeriensis TaxID=1500506 RepID=A0A368W049_9ACTN|nr:APC family permease [Halopolyspora algeriensis]RCW47002.1 amino acid/polyamine/organocation transporter (APC superfamily) [Halopolyspora algeriensis]TQM48090.1 amino acid/polyamine/organocation transporter (APC superfamily) [Halopolyspora algeriensis]
MATPTAPPTRADVQLDHGVRRDVNKISLLFTGVGAIIGSGWLFGALNGAQIAGPAAIFSWIIGAIMIMLIGFAYAELAVMFPVVGGIIRFPHYSFGSFASFSSGWISWLAAAAVTPIEVLATLQYTDPYVPWLMNHLEDEGVWVVTGPGLVVSVVLMALYSAVNVLGVHLFAKLNNALVWWKLAVIALLIVVLFAVSFNPGNLTDFGGFAPNGYGTIFTAIPAAGVAFSYLGFRNGVEFAGETDNPQRNVPFALVGSVVITAIIYVLLQIAFITGLPEAVLGNGWANLSFEDAAGPLAGLSLLLGVGWMAWLLRLDAIISPADTGLIYAGVTARLSYANARNDNAPQALTKLNNRGVPWVSVLLMFVVGCFFFLPFPGWAQFVGFLTAATALSFGPGCLVVGALRRQIPDQDRPFKLPGGDIIPLLAFFCANLLVFWSTWSINEKMLIALLAGYVVFVIYHMVAKHPTPPINFKSGSWFPIWLAGMLVFSYLSELTPNGQAAPGIFLNGGDGPLGVGLGAVAIAIWSGVIYYYAMAVRLPSQEAIANIEKTPTDAPTTA